MKARNKSNFKDFSIEIVAHYPSDKERNTGTFHFYWEEMDLDIRGVFYSLNFGTKPWIRLPSWKGVLNGESCTYPLLSFPNVKKTQRFTKTLREAFLEYALENKLKKGA